MSRWLTIVGVVAALVLLACSRKESPPTPSPPGVPASQAEQGAPSEADTGEAPEVDKASEPAPTPQPPQAESDPHIPPTLPSTGDLDPELLARFLSTANPIPAWVDQAIGGATQPEAEPAPFHEAVALFQDERVLLKKRRKEIRERARAVIQAGVKGKLPARKRLAAGFKSHTLLGDSLEAASIRFRQGPRPLDGGSDQGVVLSHIGQLLGAAGVDALLEGKHEAAMTWFKRLTRYGAIVAAGSQTLAERAAGVSAAKDGLGLLETVIRRKPELAGGLEPTELRPSRRHLGAYGASLGRLNRFFFQPENLKRWEDLARTQRDPLWVHEALGSLYRTSWMRSGTKVSEQAYEALRRLSAADAPSVGRAAAGRYFAELDKKRSGSIP